MERRTRKMLLAILMIISVLATDFFVLGSEIITYALQSNSETNNTNIEFSTYFKEGNNRIDSIEKSIKSEDLRLYAEIKVKKEGYLKEGTVIELENSNFNFKNEILPSNKYIKSIDGNKVILKQIDSESIMEIELGIEPIITEKQTPDFLSKTSTVKMKGVYVYSKSEEGEAITADKLVCVNYIPDEITDVELDTKIITNKVFSVNGTNKKVVQVLVRSRLNENSYPVKQTILKANISTLGEGEPEVNAIAVNKLATNGMNLISNLKVEDGIAEIIINNDPDANNQINWNKNIYDEVVITYIYPENADTSKLEITTELETKIYNSEKIYTAKHTTKSTSEELNNIIIGRTEITTNELYKGKIYENIETQYNTKTSIVVTNPNIVGEVTVNENSDIFGMTEKTLTPKTKYISTKINLENMLNILGEDGSLTIKNGDITTVVNKESEADSNGNIVVNYENSASNIDITINNTSGNRLNAGILELEHTKSIIENDYSRKQLQEVKTLNTRGTISALLDNVKIAENAMETSSLELKETTTKAELTIENNKQTLSTTNQNEMVLGIRLVTSGPQHDLFKNPRMSIKFPQAVNNVELISNPNKQNADEFIVSVGNFNTTNKTLQIKLQGEQTKYQQSELMQPYIQLNFKITLDKLALAQTDKIIMEYINENAVQYNGGRTDMGIEEKVIQISAPNQLIKRYNLNTNKNTSLTETILQKVKNQNKLDFGISLTNNKDSDISNLKILGKLPTTKNTISGQGENTLETTLKGINAPNARIYYTENSSANTDVQETKNGWTQDLSSLNNAKLYLIELENLKRGETYTANLEVESGSATGLSYTQYGVIYDTTTKTNVKESSRKIGLATSMAASIKTNIKAEVGQDVLAEGDAVKEGEVIKYTVTVENKGTQTLEKVSLKLDVPEGTTYVKPMEDYVYEDGYYEEITDAEKLNQLVNITIPQLKTTEPYVVQYELRVNKDSQKVEIMNNPIITYDGTQVDSTGITNKIQKGNLRVSVKRSEELSNQIHEGGSANYKVYIENISNSEINNIGMKILSEEFDIRVIQNNETYLYGDEISEKMVIEKLKPNETIYFGIEGKIKKGVDKIDIMAIVEDEQNNQYRSNLVRESVPSVSATINMTSPQNNGYIKEGDKVEYNITVKNTGDIEEGIDIESTITDILEIESISTNGKVEKQTTNPEDTETYRKKISNEISEGVMLNVGETAQFKIVAKVKYVPDTFHGYIIHNYINLRSMKVEQGSSQIITHILRSKELEDQNVENMISGFAWFDENENGRKDENEKVLPDIKVKIYDVNAQDYLRDEGAEPIYVETNENGLYTYTNIKDGTYLIIFEYDTEKYVLTTPYAENVDNTLNSKATIKKIDGHKYITRVAGVEINNLKENIFSINIGLKENIGDVPIEEQPGIEEKPVDPDKPIDPDIPVDPDVPTDPDIPVDPENPTDPNIPVDPEDSKKISGYVWFDSNGNGRKDEKDKYLSGVKVRLYDVNKKDYLTDQSGNKVEILTDGNGKYEFNNIKKGSYKVIFEYNTEEYEVIETNANIVVRNVNINGKEITIAVTNTLDVQNNISNINLGLQENLKFDLELNKYISKIVVQTKKKTKTYDYKGETLGKVEIHRKEVEGALVVLEYTIKIKNAGEIPGYARNIVDYLPRGLSFSSELNKDWYLSENNLHTKFLENVELKPGEEKEVKLVLTKTMTNENLGLINNTAEIYQDYNKQGENDNDSTPNNQVQSEDDFGTTDVIIQVATGGSVGTYIILAIINVILIVIAIKIMIINGVIQIKTKEERR